MTTSRARLAFHIYAAATVAGLWMLTQPYSGLRHDAILYLAQAMRWSRPEQFSQDLFFAFGSQDRYSIYSLILGPILAHAELWIVQPVIIWLCRAAFLAAIWWLLPAQLSLRQRWLCMAALVLIRPLYGGLSIFCYNESFLTARTLAEPLALWSIVCFHRQGRIWTAWLLMLLATLMHPLMSVAALVWLWLLCCARDRRWLILLPLGLGAVVALALAGKPPFDGLLRQYPDDWWKIAGASFQVFLKNWGSNDWAAITVDFAILIGAWHLYRPPHRILVPTLVIGTVALVILAVLGSHLYRNVLITQLQLWRGLWLVRAVSVALTPALLIAIARRGPAGLATACSLACVISMANLHWEQTWVGMLWPALHLWIWRTRRHVSATMLRASTATSMISLLAIGVADYIHVRGLPTGDTIFLNFSSLGIALVVSPLLALACLAWLWRAHWRVQAPALRSAMAYGLPASTVALVLTGALLWDRRPPITRYLESHLHSPHPFEAFVPTNAAVYWDNGLDAAWFILKRESYFSPAQGAGLLFNETTAHAWTKRNEAFRDTGKRRASCELFTMLLGKLQDGEPPCYSLPEYEAEAICRKATTLQFLVATNLYSRKPLAVWDVPGDQGVFKTQYLYACSSFR